MANNIQPIWKDYYVYLGAKTSPNNYSIWLNGDTCIFNGKAWCPPSYKPTTGVLNVSYPTKINGVCENYLSNDIEDFNFNTPTTIEHTNALNTFQIVDEDDNTTLIDEVTFVYDWSFDNTIDYSNSNPKLSRPVNGRGKDGMYFFITSCNKNNLKVSTYVTKTPNIDIYHYADDCNSNWALYYLNKYGGWDSFLIEGYVSKTEKFTRSTLNREYNNNIQQFGTTPYLTEINPSYEIHTGWLNETESDILATNLFQSTRVFLHNLETDEIIPVVITNTDVLYKTRKNSNRKLLNYTINVDASQKRYNKN